MTIAELVWLDLEMTGLDITTDTILEVAVLVTDNDLSVTAYGPHMALHASENTLTTMNEWCQRQHGLSGLTQACRISTTTLEQAQDEIVTFLERDLQGKRGILCGNSIWQDRLFLEKYMPRVCALLHYRMIDVSTLRELLTRWYPSNPMNIFKKSDTHRAFNDILESIEQLKQYKNHFFIS